MMPCPLHKHRPLILVLHSSTGLHLLLYNYSVRSGLVYMIRYDEDNH